MFENFDDFRNTIETLEKMHRKNHEEEMLSQFYSKHGRMPVHDDGFYLYGSEEDHKHTIAVEATINRNKTEISESELSEKVEKEEVETEEFRSKINAWSPPEKYRNDIPNETSRDIYLTASLDRAKLERAKNESEIQMQLQEQQNKQNRYSISSTNKAYGENDSLEIFNPTQVFSSGVSVY